MRPKFPDEFAKGFASAKSHTIGNACLPNVLTTCNFVGRGLHVQRVELPSITLSTANARYVASASAYSSGAPSLEACSLTCKTKSLSVFKVRSCRFENKSRKRVNP